MLAQHGRAQRRRELLLGFAARPATATVLRLFHDRARVAQHECARALVPGGRCWAALQGVRREEAGGTGGCG